MGLRVNSNIASLNAQRSLSMTTERLQANYRRLSTGLRISTASDDAAGLAISERFRAQVRSTNQAVRNAQDGISLTQTGEGALNEVSSILVRMRELAIQANNGTVSAADRTTLHQEFSDLINEIDRIAQSTTFNGVHLLDGTGSTITFQVGTGTTTGIDTIQLNTSDTLASTLGLSSLDIGSAGSPTTAIVALDSAINSVSRVRGQFGAAQNRLSTTIANLQIQVENLSAAESRIRDVDVAVETSSLTRNSILQQSAISILAQANTQPQAALQLLRNQ
ncbi:MAG: flagellin FliC [Planctomycetes bacterium]|mgnify:CR=1 FL=1|nr:flagellin FliC [Planctomycetota bacterium]